MRAEDGEDSATSREEDETLSRIPPSTSCEHYRLQYITPCRKAVCAIIIPIISLNLPVMHRFILVSGPSPGPNCPNRNPAASIPRVVQ